MHASASRGAPLAFGIIEGATGCWDSGTDCPDDYLVTLRDAEAGSCIEISDPDGCLDCAETSTARIVGDADDVPRLDDGSCCAGVCSAAPAST